MHIVLSFYLRTVCSMQHCRVEFHRINVFGSIKGVLWHPVCIKLICLCPRVANRMPAVKCVHLKRRARCAECGGGEICSHGKQKYQYGECVGRGICRHGKNRFACRDCVGSSICQHGTFKRFCGECGGNGLCEHRKQRLQCNFLQRLHLQLGSVSSFRAQFQLTASSREPRRTTPPHPRGCG